MALPLPSIVANTGPGGNIVTAMGGINALRNAMNEGDINAIKAQYAPLTTQAEAASKLAYANLMGPQFLAKLLGNPDIVANLKDPQSVVQAVQQAGQGGLTSGNALNQLSTFNNQHQSLGGLIINHLRNLFGGGSSGSANNLLQQPSAQPQQTTISQQTPQDNSSAISNDTNSNAGEVAQATTAWITQPEVIAKAHQEGMYSIPPTSQLLNWYRNRNQNEATTSTTMPTPSTTPNTSYAENAGSYGGIVAEGKKAGEIRAQDIKDLGDTVFNAQTKQSTLDNLSKIISSPDFEKMRQTPILGSHELSFYQRYGTPAQQNMVGQLVTLSGNIIRDASQDFKGAFRKGEQELIQNMKINPSDTFDAARGKMEQLSYLNQMIKNRAQLTAHYMQQNHMSKIDAEELADKQLNGDTLRTNIHNELNPKPTNDDINFMAQKYKVTPDEIKRRLKAKGIL